MRHRARLSVVALVVLVVAMAGTPSAATILGHPPPSTSTSPPVDMTVRGDSLMVAGDITCSPTGGLAEGRRITPAQAAACNVDARAVHDMALGLRPAGFLLAGDLIEPCGTLAELGGTFDRIWGDQWERIAPAMGNHEYCGTPGAGPSRTTGGRRRAAATSTTSAATAAAPAPATPATTPSTSSCPRVATGMWWC